MAFDGASIPSGSKTKIQILFVPATDTSPELCKMTGLQPSLTYMMESQAVLLPVMEIRTLLDLERSPALH